MAPSAISDIKAVEKEHHEPLPSEFRREIIHREWHYPLPPPEILEKYNDIVPNMAERLLSNLEFQTKHRCEIEKHVIFSRSSNMKRGQYIAGIISIAVIVVATYLAVNGHPILAGSIVGFDFIGLTSAYCVGQYTQREERAKKKTQREPEVETKSKE